MPSAADSGSEPPVVLFLGGVKGWQHLENPISTVARIRHLPVCDSDRSAFLESEGRDVVAAVTNSIDGFPSSLFPSLPNLRLISNHGVGVDTIDVQLAHSLNVEVTNTPDVLTDDVADIALGLMLCTARSLCYSDKYVRDGRWPKEGFPPLTSKFSGSTVGILGLGRIGKAIAERAEGFGCNIDYYSRNKKADVPYKFHETPVSLAAASDFLVVACSLTAETKGIVSREVLEALGSKGSLINIGRGAHVDEPALVEALVQGKIKGAGLDVFADEPHVPKELLSLENVVLLPHIGTNSRETRQVMGKLVVDNVFACLDNRLVLTPLPKHV